MKVLTVARLKKLGACASAVRAFKRTFGKQARLTPANMDKAQATVGLSPAWLAEKLKLVPEHTDTPVNCPGCRAERQEGYDRQKVARRALLRQARG